MSGPETQTKREAFLAATDTLISAVMEARSEHRDGAIGLSELRYTVDVAFSTWHKVAWIDGLDPREGDYHS